MSCTPGPRPTLILAALTGYFPGPAVLPVLSALPALREFQRAQGLVAAAWLQDRVETGLL
ncbi:hypothetical protein [Microbacterium sp. CFBP9034]|uniref:hypothetical protein n=1 Tax=Microbacterium sp. CFBP9034 TaxID=3096540 RepID=UPI002A6A925A|nr:hypothetical protein [Microbacterium sp. CFBP9034]MDY0910657.1 hypothetical protein [Microbacterium sp. CFBP9034]